MSNRLGFFKKISQASAPEQSHMLAENMYEIFSFLTLALEEDPYYYTYYNDDHDRWAAQEDQRFVSDVRGPNGAWCWSNENKGQILYVDGVKEDLRRWGYVMWDKRRLDDWSVLSQDNTPYVHHIYD